MLLKSFLDGNVYTIFVFGMTIIKVCVVLTVESKFLVTIMLWDWLLVIVREKGQES